MLTNYTSLNAAEPSLTAFDTNLKSILVLLENAHVFPSKVSPDAQKILSALQNDAALKAHSFKPMLPRSNTTILDGSSANSGIAAPRRTSSNNSGGSASLSSASTGASPSVVSESQQSSNSDVSTLMEPVKIRTRTKTNVASFQLQSQLLESLATPYVDEAWTTVIKRVGSIASIAQSSANLQAAAATSGLPSIGSSRRGSANPSNALVHPLSSKFASRQSVFTSSCEAPYTILTGNDLGCLIFGMSKSEMRKLTILDLIGSGSRTKVSKIIEQQKKDQGSSVALCGHIFPIKKFNGQGGFSSFWAKCNKPNGIITWVIEEVVCDSASIKVDLETGIVSDVQGPDKDILFPYLDTEDKDILIHDIISGMPENLSDVDPTLYEEHVTISGKVVIPCSTKVEKIENDTKKVSVKLFSLPHMAGVVMIDRETLEIIDYNASFILRLLGYGTDEAKGLSVNDLIPNFTTVLDMACSDMNVDLKMNGLVLPEHMFRKLYAKMQSSEEEGDLDSLTMFMKSTGIPALHRDGHFITLDVQLRTLDTSYYALWISFSRNLTGAHEANVPSQLSLLTLKKKGLHRHTTSRSDSHGRHSSESSTNSLSAASIGSMTGLTSNENSSTKVNEMTPREKIIKEDNLPNSASSVYSIHIPELGARRREKSLDDFNILQKMGEGAYGKVLLAEYKEEPKLRVVLKCVIKERILVDTWTRDKKLGTIPSEIKVMAVLKNWPHANVIQLLDFFEDDQFYHIEMEPHGSPGTDLFDLIELQPTMSEAQCRSIFKQVVAAVRHLHQHDIVHRDIKDENIIVDGDGLVKLIDFGSSAFIRQGPFDVFVGTIDYAAPEVLSGMPYEGKPQDIWALGILLYTIIYKENPFYSVDEIMEHELRIPFVSSEACIDLVKMILVRDLRKRPSIDDIWNHEWMQVNDIKSESV